jgi:hypothetical protein
MHESVLSAPDAKFELIFTPPSMIAEEEPLKSKNIFNVQNQKRGGTAELTTNLIAIPPPLAALLRCKVQLSFKEILDVPD